MWSVFKHRLSFLATSPESIILLDNEKFGIVDVTHHDNSIETVCQDQVLCLSIVEGGKDKHMMSNRVACTLWC